MTREFSNTERDAIVLNDLILTLLTRAEIYDDDAITLTRKLLVTSGVSKTQYHFIIDLIDCVREESK